MNMEILKKLYDEQLNEIAKLSAEDIHDMFIEELERRENILAEWDYKINIGDCWMAESEISDVINIKYIEDFEDSGNVVVKHFHIDSEDEKNIKIYKIYDTEKSLKRDLLTLEYTKIDPSIIDKLDELTDIYNRCMEELNNDYYEKFVNILNLKD